MSWSAGNGRGGPVCPPAGFPPDPCGDRRGGNLPPGEMWAAGRRPRWCLLPQGACPAGMHPPFLFCRAKRETGRARSKEKSVGALRCSGPPRDGGRRIGASADLARPSGTLYSSAISPTAVPWRIVRRSSGWSSHGAASLFAAASCPARELPIKASAPTTARAARSEAERAERGAGQMRPCTPLTSASTPRESAFKPVPHPAAPVGQSSQTRRHHLTPTPVQQLCTPVQSCGQKRSFLLDRARPVFFSGKTEKKMGGASR